MGMRWRTSLVALALAVAPAALGCPVTSGDPFAKLGDSGADFLGAEISGTWYAPDRNGEGIALQMLEDGAVAMVWFTYPAQGEAGEQAWLLGVSNALDGSRLRFERVVRPMGARFGAAFDPADVVNHPWGSIELEFVDCDRLTLRYEGPVGYGEGERQLERLTAPDQLGCGSQRRTMPNGARALDGLRSRSGTWFVPSRSGEGWLVDELPNGTTGLYWFTYDEAGRQRWILGTGQRQGDRLVIGSARIPRGTRFGADFRSADVVLSPFGRIEVEFDGCARMHLGYDAEAAGLGSDQRVVDRLTRVAGLPCIAGSPAATAGSAWRELASMPGNRQSELAVTRLGNALYALGGFGSQRALKRYVPATDEWTTLPSMPDGRHHLAAFAADGAVYYVGGGTDGFDPDYSEGYGFDLATQQWSRIPGFLPTFGSHAAMLHGRAWIGNLDGSLQVFEPRTGRVKRIAPQPGGPQRDHSQVVAFMDEIWMIAGRSPETTRVAIYDPIAAQWREGPPIRTPRGGFAAAVVGPRIVIAGGEVLEFAGASLIGSTEIYSAGSSAWNDGLAMPVPVHGTAGAGFGDTFVLVSGSVQAGRMSGATGRVFALDLPP